MSDQFLLFWIIFHSLVLAFGFSVGLAVGLKIPIAGDTIAMLLVGGLLMFMQYTLLHDKFGVSNAWIKYSFIGLILGVGLAFLFIFFFDKALGLSNAHIWGLPIALLFFTISQAFVFKNEDIKPVNNLYLWPIISLLALTLAGIILYFVNTKYNLAFDLLGDRRQELDKVVPWGFTGFIIGLVYSLFTVMLLNK